MEIGSRERHLKFFRFIEVDRATEHQDKIRDKCIRYWRAYQAWPGDVYPRVLFVVLDQARADSITRVIQASPVEARRRFEVCTFDGFTAAASGT